MYLVFDGVENETHFIEDETEAKTKLKELIESSLDDGEWMNGVENSCIARITAVIDKKEVKAPDDYRLDSGISKWYDMEIKNIWADCQPHKSGDLHGQATKLPLEVIVEEVDLVGCFDAQVWAKEFCKRNTSSDEGTMLGWFANAIMAGYDYAKQEAKLEANGNAQQLLQPDAVAQVKQMLARQPAAFNKSKADKLREEKKEKNMKKAIIAIMAVFLVAVFTGCSGGNANLKLQCSQAIVSETQITGEILYAGYSFHIQRIKINGVNYLVNSKGGIIKE